MLIGIIGVLLIQWVVIARMQSRISRHASHLRRDKSRLVNLSKRITDITKYGNSSLSRNVSRIESNEQQAEYLEDKIDTLLELLIQEHEDSVE